MLRIALNRKTSPKTSVIKAINEEQEDDFLIL